MFDEKGNLISHWSFKYNDKGKLKEKLTLLLGDEIGNQKTLYKYNSKGEIIEETFFSRDGHIEKLTTKYNEAGKTVEYVYNSSVGSINYHKTTKYDNLGNIIEEIQYNTSNQPEEKIEYIYSK
jgi:hypothetical protein